MKYLIIGGSKSGKSEIGEKIALSLSREPKSMIWCESLKQTSQIYDLMMVAYSVSTQRTNVSRVSLIFLYLKKIFFMFKDKYYTLRYKD